MNSFCAYLTCLLHVSDPGGMDDEYQAVFLRADGGRRALDFSEGKPGISHWLQWFRVSQIGIGYGARGRRLFRHPHLCEPDSGHRQAGVVAVIRGRGVFSLLRFRARLLGSAAGFFDKNARRATCHFFDMQKQHGFSWTERKTAHSRLAGRARCADGRPASAANDRGSNSHARFSLALASVDLFFSPRGV